MMFRMDVTAYTARLHRDLYAAGQLGGEEALAIAEKMAQALDPAMRMVLLDALVEAAGEITEELSPGAVEVRLLGREVQFAVTAPGAAAQLPVQPTAVPAPKDEPEDDGGTARLSLRLPERLKGRVEEAAGTEGLSVNAWLVRSISQVVDAPAATQNPPGTSLPPTVSGQRITGWAR